MFNTLELIMYMEICRHYMAHDKSVSSLLLERSVKKRFRRNIVDLAAHMVAFALENTLLIMLCLYAYAAQMPQKFSKALLALFGLTMNYAILGIAQIITSKVLKDEFAQFLYEVLLADQVYKFFRILNMLGFFWNVVRNLAFFRAFRRHAQ